VTAPLLLGLLVRLFKDSLFTTTTPAKTYPRQIADIVTEPLRKLYISASSSNRHTWSVIKTLSVDIRMYWYGDRIVDVGKTRGRLPISYD